MTSTKTTSLDSLRKLAAGGLGTDNLSNEDVEKFEEANELVRDLGDDNLVDYVSRRYRDWYRAWQAGERRAPCECSNPACPLKNGRLPYAIRRDTSPFSLRDGDDTAEHRLRSYLDEHPEALVIDDTMDELETKRFRAEDLFREVITSRREGTEAETGRKGPA